MKSVFDSPRELAEVCQDRAETYQLLARLFRTEADEALLAGMREALYPADNGNEDLDAGSYAMAKYLSNLWENSVSDLAVDYSRCFVGQGTDGKSAAYPFESVYRSDKHLMMQEARDEVLAIYRSVGLGKAEDYKESEDSLAAELEFMAILSQRAAEACERGDVDEAKSLILTQANFLDDHLAVWAPACCADVRRFARTEFYRAAALLVRGTIASDQAMLAAWTEELRAA